MLNSQYNKSLQTSEGWNLAYINDYEGGLNLASTINRNYVVQNQTAMVVWNLVYSWYSILPFARVSGGVAGQGHGLMTAAEPWSGHYSLKPPLYVMMHTTQFVEPGVCNYIESGGITGHGWLDAANLSTIVAFRCQKVLRTQAVQRWVVAVVETSGLNATLDTELSFNGLAPEYVPTALRVFETCQESMFKELQNITASTLPSQFSVSFRPACVYTLVSADAGRGSSIPHKLIPNSQSFPQTWSDDFDSYTDQQTVKYFTDEAGSFNAAKSPTATAGMVLQQAVASHPINGRWWGNSQPYTLLGNSQNWTDTTVAVTAFGTANGGSSVTNISASFTRVCARISVFSPHGAPPQGYCLIVGGDGKWFLTAGGRRGPGWSELIAVVASGTLPGAAALYTGRWHRLQLDVIGNTLTGTVDGKVAGVYTDEQSRFTHGMVAIGSGWHVAYFDNFTVNATTSNMSMK